MSRRLTAEEKGKGVRPPAPSGNYKRIRAPELDTSALIHANLLTLIGRLTNPQVQRVKDVLSALPKKWNLEGSVTGSELDHNCFQFRLSSEKDLKLVLANCPYHCDNWMVIIQRWEPIISSTFPSKIPFWIELRGLPLHFWHHKMIYKIGHELGTLDDYEISATSARMRVLIDGLGPLTKETIIDFDSGEECLLTLEYEGLKNHCSVCSRLSHLQADCPYRETLGAGPAYKSQVVSPGDRRQRISPEKEETRVPQVNAPPRNDFTEGSRAPLPQAFSKRFDRHGRPFGERVSLSARPVPPLRNKITPRAVSHDASSAERNEGHHRYDRETPPAEPIPTEDKRGVWRRKHYQVRDSSNSSHDSPPVENTNVRHDSRTTGNIEDLRGSLQRHLPQYHTSPFTTIYNR